MASDPLVIQEMWPIGGILDLPDSWEALSLISMREVEQTWREELLKVENAGRLAEFNERLNRKWAIETGQIENLYDIESGVTVQLINHGFDAAFMPHGSVNKDPEMALALLEDQKVLWRASLPSSKRTAR